MSMTPIAAKTYADVGLETAVASASPHQLILLLFDGALLALAKAGSAMAQGDIAEKGRTISMAINIIANGLGGSLDFTAGDALAERLAALYDYMSQRLVHANANNDAAALKEVSSLLGEIKSAWEAIGDASDAESARGGKVAA
jgi:flagellar protein FliS